MLYDTGRELYVRIRQHVMAKLSVFQQQLDFFLGGSFSEIPTNPVPKKGREKRQTTPVMPQNVRKLLLYAAVGVMSDGARRVLC